MARSTIIARSSILLILLLPLLALAQHDHDHTHDDTNHDAMMDMAMGLSSDEPKVPSYFGLTENSSPMTAHVLLMTLAWVGLLPIAVMLSIARSRAHLPARMAFYTANTLGLIAGVIYDARTPDLYQGNAHHPMGWIVSAISIAWTLLDVGKLVLERRIAKASSNSIDESAIAEGSSLLRSLHHRAPSEDYHRGSSIDNHTSGTRHSSVDSNNTLTEHETLSDLNDFEDCDLEKAPTINLSAQSRPLHHKKLSVPVALFTLVNIAHATIERTILLFGFAVFCTGIVVYGGIFREGHVFGGLAHFIKGGIFLWYGLLVLGRWSGSFGELGWAWNARPQYLSRWVPTAEFSESALIFVYGASNFFLENLGPAGEHAWSPHNLEHVSITVLFFGGGLLGMLIESSRFRDAFERPLRLQHGRLTNSPESASNPSLNPIPAVIILLLGIMMSSHTQHSHSSAQMHSLWGNMFAAAALARGVTYVTIWLKPPTHPMPSRPPSELVAAFCLVGGGGIFMASNEDTVAAMEHSGLDSMTVFTVGMGLTGLVMAWTLFVLAIKGAATPVPTGVKLSDGSDEA